MYQGCGVLIAFSEIYSENLAEMAGKNNRKVQNTTCELGKGAQGYLQLGQGMCVCMYVCVYVCMYVCMYVLFIYFTSQSQLSFLPFFPVPPSHLTSLHPPLLPFSSEKGSLPMNINQPWHIKL